MMIWDPTIENRAQDLRTACVGRYDLDHFKNPDLLVIARIAQANNAAVANILRDLEHTIANCLKAGFNPDAKSVNKGEKFVFRALQLLSAQTTEVERKMIELAIPALESMRESPGLGASSVATFKPEYRELNSSSNKYQDFVKTVNDAYGNRGYKISDNGESEFKDGGCTKKLRLINTGSMGAIFMVSDSAGNPIKVIRTVSAGEAYPSRRKVHFSDYQAATAPNALLSAGNFHTVISNNREHIVESFSHCAAPMLVTRLNDPNVDPIKDLTAVAASLAEIHKSGLIATNLKPDNMHIESKPDRALNARFVNPSLFSHHSRIFSEYFAGSLPFRYYGDDYISAFNGNAQSQTAEVAAKTDLWSFGVNLFQALVPGYLFSGDGLAGKVNSDNPLTAQNEVPAVSKDLNQFLCSDNVAPHMKVKSGNFVRNIYSWAASSKSADEIRDRLEQVIGDKYSAAKKQAIKNLLVTLLTFAKQLDGKYIMAKPDGTAPTAEWVHQQMLDIAKIP